MDRISRRSQGPEGVRFGNHRISSLLFADDVVLLASSSQDLQHVLERFAAECEAAGMRISTSKSEAMVLDRKRVVCPLRVSGELLPQVEEFKYLGVLFTSEGKMEREIDRRIGAASCSYAVGVPDRRGEEGAESKGEALDLPVNLRSQPLTYGHELWVMTERTRSRIQAAKMSFLRRVVAGRSLRDRGGVPGVSHREEALGEDPGHAGETMSLEAGLGTPRGSPPEELEEVSGDIGEGVATLISNKQNFEKVFKMGDKDGRFILVRGKIDVVETQISWMPSQHSKASHSMHGISASSTGQYQQLPCPTAKKNWPVPGSGEPIVTSSDYPPPLFPVNEEEVTVPSAHAMARRCKKVWGLAARQMLLRGQDRMKAAADRHRRPAPAYTPGQKV
ncbi:hypothetical protein L3Q82_001931 [Scortum barcoo]|uniref:Uncharacterized protein n=1 Tax=Scortum barcoo TaxID=214431 RepID=A0ACB8W1R6_9TELE|nr:hypothetical protein L3Q82_001931 [Scortum barcoo]